MIRRFGPGVALRRSTSQAPALSFNSTTVRGFHSVYGLAASLITCGACILCFASWANNICNVRKYGRWRFRNSIDDVIMVSDFKAARYLGGFIGFFFYWFIVGPKKYMYDSNLADIPDNKRFGPF